LAKTNFPLNFPIHVRDAGVQWSPLGRLTTGADVRHEIPARVGHRLARWA
uniref:Agglutinin-1 (Fragments) n=1 Tax=Pomacea flagellata TaxID=249358 RepID=AGG1_POMFL|nr:RecName: Full=Agglutinin-1; AltName: Full=PFA-1 [Pomacea flagellata]